MPAVSVVIPTHNRAGHVAAAIESALRQTFRDVEVVVADDASTDNTAEVVAAFRDPRVRYVRHTINRGDAAARNAGIQRSSGKYIAFLDDDDEWMPEKLSWQLAEFEKGGERLGLVHGGRETFFTATGRSSVLLPEGDVETQLRSSQITTSTVMVRRDGIEKVGLFDEDIPYCSDYDLWIRLWRAGFRIACIDRPLVKYFVHGNGLSGNPLKMIAGKEKLLQKHPEFFAEDPASQSGQYQKLGLLYCKVGDVRTGRKALVKAMRLRSRVSTSAYYLLTWFGGGLCRRIVGIREFLGKQSA